MEHPQPDRDVGSSIPIPAILATVVALALIVGGFYGYRTLSGDQAQHEIVIATGPETGTYHALGEALARVLEGASVVESAEVLSTGGSVENMERIDGASGGAESRRPGCFETTSRPMAAARPNGVGADRQLS